MPAVIEVFGDRQVGKPEMAMQSALLHAADGDTVLWLAPLKVAAIDVLHRFDYWRRSAHPLSRLISLVRFGHGDECVRSGDGRIVFRSVRSPGRGILPDVLVLDDVLLPDACAPMLPRLKKLYSIACTGD